MEIKSLTEYLEHVQQFEQQHIAQWLYRGMRNVDHELIPSLFRIDISNTLTDWDELEEYMLGIFKREARPFLEKLPQDDLELLTLAQHHGLPTRLLDWSTNPLIALFFALERYDRCVDAVVWCYGCASTHNCHPESTRIDRRLTVEKMSNIIFPYHISPRITNQAGCFTAHDLPNSREKFVPFDKQVNSGLRLFDKIIIKSEHQKKIMNQLYDLGYHHGLIYPGLVGLSKRIKYEASTTHSRCSNDEQLRRYLQGFK